MIDIRALRGARSRASFARLLGVTAQTVYRWELPDSAPEARRPRGQQLARLSELSRELKSTPSGRPAAAAAFAKTPPHAPPSAAHAIACLPFVDEDTARVLPALERVFRGDPRHGHDELLKIVTASQGLSLHARAVAYYGIAAYELLQRGNARAALLAIGTVLSDAEAGVLQPEIAAKLFAVAALAHSMPDALLFDLSRVHAYQSRIDALVGRSDPEATCIATLAAMSGAALAGDGDLIERAFARIDEAQWTALPALLELHLDEFRMLRALYAGKSAYCMQDGESIAARAEQHGYPLVLARALGKLALSELDNLVDPEQVLARARRAKAIWRGVRTGNGAHQLHTLRAEIEALLRLGRTEEALLISGEVDVWSAETGIPPLAAVAAQTRLYQLTGRLESLHALAASLRSCELPALRTISLGYASFVEAVALLVGGAEPAAATAAFEQAELEAGRWPFLLREVLLYRVYAQAAAGHENALRVALRRAQRFIDGFPSPWFTAHLRRLEGGLLAARGQWSEGKQLLESSAATFELAKDKPDAALTRYLHCLIATVFETDQGEALEAARRALIELGLREPAAMRLGVSRFRAQLPESQGPRARPARSSEALVVPFQRVAMRGAAPNLILSELVAVTAGLFPDRGVYLEEIDSRGTARVLAGSARAPASEVEWFEFSDGAGRLLRLGVFGALEHDERSTLALLTMTTALSLEVAVLRSIGERPAVVGNQLPPPEVPGFVAASAEMRQLRAELGRLAGSRSTVIITGESGAGKELVARAIHDLSERVAQPYVAFNCATVPRDLFEGQLFGYRRGAFTGAASDNPGVIRAANRGTLFLDEIGELPLDIQPKLLRFLENAEVFPLGERAPVRVDVRVLAATHRDLANLVREGKFREDLYYRLQVVPVFVPPLRDRRADIPVLARHFLRELTPRSGEPPVLAPDALAALIGYDFPGNVRELRNIIERAMAYFSEQPVLRAEHLRLPVALTTRRPR
jgi:hypothetical protein